MAFSPTTTHQSKAVPGASFTVHRMGFTRRADLDMQTLSLRQKLREIERAYPPQSAKEKEIARQVAAARKKAESVPEDEVAAVLENELKPLIDALTAAATPEDAAKREALDMEYVATDNLIHPHWIRSGLISISGGEVDGMPADALLDYGPPDLAAEIYRVLSGDGKLSGDDAKNSQSPSTSGAPVDGTIPIIGASDASASQSETVSPSTQAA